MPLEDILKKISAKAGVLTEEILSSAKNEAEARIREAREKAALLEAEILEESTAEARQIKSIAASRRDMEKKQMILRAKQDLISQVFKEAVGRLNDLPNDEYRKLLLTLISQKAKGTEELLLSKDDDSRLGSNFHEDVGTALKQKGKAADVKISYSPHRFGGGFMLREGGVSDNVTFPVILNLIREDLEIELAKILFEKALEKENKL